MYLVFEWLLFNLVNIYTYILAVWLRESFPRRTNYVCSMMGRVVNNGVLSTLILSIDFSGILLSSSKYKVTGGYLKRSCRGLIGAARNFPRKTFRFKLMSFRDSLLSIPITNEWTNEF